MNFENHVIRPWLSRLNRPSSIEFDCSSEALCKSTRRHSRFLLALGIKSSHIQPRLPNNQALPDRAFSQNLIFHLPSAFSISLAQHWLLSSTCHVQVQCISWLVSALLRCFLRVSELHGSSGKVSATLFPFSVWIADPEAVRGEYLCIFVTRSKQGQSLQRR